jgi:glucose/arabinose dehydrogenase
LRSYSLLKSKFILGITLSCILILTSVSFPISSAAQTGPVTVAAGFELNLFADPNNIPEFKGTGITGTFIGPSALAFDKSGRLFVATLSGKILILLDNNDDGRADQVKTFATGVPTPLGMTFRGNGDLFITSNQLAFLGGLGRIMRLRDTNGDDVADEQTIIVDGLPSTGDHQTDRLRFGPDGLLYFGQGSATDNGVPKPGRPAEGPLNGTMLRINVDTPNPTPEIFARGLRNPFGMAFHPVNGELFSTDGGSGEICQFGDCGVEDLAPKEEVNWIVQGGNYGFPLCEGTPDSREGCAGVRPALQQFSPHLTPTSLVFYTGPQAGDFTNQLLVTIFKRYKGEGGSLRRLKLDGDKNTGFRVLDNQEVAEFGLIDPGDGPVDTALDTITGDIYVARTDTVTHRDENEHHHFIYRIHRQGSDALPFIGATSPTGVKVGSGGVTLNLVGRHLKSGAVVLADGLPVPTRQGASLFALLADLPASSTATARAITIQVRNPDGSLSNQQSFAVTTNDPPPPPDKLPQITSSFVYFKNRGRVITPVVVAPKGKKYGLVVSGTDFDAGAQLLLNGTALELLSSSATELTGRLTNGLLAQSGIWTIQIRNSDNKVSNIVTITVLAQ